MTITVSPTSLTSRHPATAKAAGFAYVGAWVLGLTAFAAGPATNAADNEVARFYSTHRAASATQSLLVHGVAAVALLALLVAMRARGRSTRVASVAGVCAVALSLVQCVLSVYRGLVATGSTTASLTHTITWLDGLKMLALALMIATSISVFRSTGLIGSRMTVVGMAAAGLLIVSGFAYTFTVTSILIAAVPALVLLLVWVGHTGVADSRIAR